MDDQRIGRILRALRHRAGLRQADLAATAGCHQTTVSSVELGRLDGVTVGLLKRLFLAVGQRFEGHLPWSGATIDRLLDAGHAALVEAVARLMRGWGWLALPEVTFSEYGERGSIDLLAGHAASRALAVFEMKTRFGALDETVRRHDAKVRLAAKLCRQRFGFQPLTVARILVVADERTNRRVAERHRQLFAAVYPSDSRQVRAWLRVPVGPLAGIWFLTLKPGPPGSRKPAGQQRVRRRHSGTDEREIAVATAPSHSVT